MSKFTKTQNVSSTHEMVKKSLKTRHASERRFKLIGIGAVAIALIALAGLFISIVTKGYSAFQQTYVALDVYLDPEILDPSGTLDPNQLLRSNTNSVIRSALLDRFPEVSGRSAKRELYSIISIGASYHLGQELAKNPSLVGQTHTLELLAGDDVDMLMKGYISRDVPEDQRRISDRQINWISSLESDSAIYKKFNIAFLQSGDSRDPEMAGILGAIVGSALTLIVTLAFAFPIGAAAAIYLEEFAPKNRICLLYTSPSPRDGLLSRMPSSA